MGVFIDSVIFQDDVHVVVNIGGGALHVSDGVTHVLRGYVVVVVDDRSRGKVVNDPVMMILPENKIGRKMKFVSIRLLRTTVALRREKRI